MAAVTAEQTNGQNSAVANGNGDRRVIIRTVGLKKTYMMKGVLTEALRRG